MRIMAASYHHHDLLQQRHRRHHAVALWLLSKQVCFPRPLRMQQLYSLWRSGLSCPHLSACSARCCP